MSSNRTPKSGWSTPSCFCTAGEVRPILRPTTRVPRDGRSRQACATGVRRSERPQDGRRGRPDSHRRHCCDWPHAKSWTPTAPTRQQSDLASTVPKRPREMTSCSSKLRRDAGRGFFTRCRTHSDCFNQLHACHTRHICGSGLSQRRIRCSCIKECHPLFWRLRLSTHRPPPNRPADHPVSMAICFSWPPTIQHQPDFALTG